MIKYMRGILLEKSAPDIVVDVHGIGYGLSLPMSSIYQLPTLGTEVILHTHFVVREDVQQLYGFATKAERQLFRDLIKVNGVGPKLALAILSGISEADFIQCIANNDSDALVHIPGVGKKTAQRLLIEMKDSVKNHPALTVVGGAQTVGGKVVVAAGNQFMLDAESALIALGYKPSDASRKVSLAYNTEIASSEELIKAALRSS